jgi:hypothetical protein
VFNLGEEEQRHGAPYSLLLTGVARTMRDPLVQAMESQACLEMTIEMFDKKMCSIHTICINDDASTRSMLKWSNVDYMAGQQQHNRAADVVDYQGSQCRQATAKA